MPKEQSAHIFAHKLVFEDDVHAHRHVKHLCRRMLHYDVSCKGARSLARVRHWRWSHMNSEVSHGAADITRGALLHVENAVSVLTNRFLPLLVYPLHVDKQDCIRVLSVKRCRI